MYSRHETMKPPNGLPMLSRHTSIQFLCLLFAALSTSTWAILPPDPDAIKNGHFESLNDYRRRLGIDFTYDTKHLNKEFCRTETEEDCQRSDEHFGKQVEKNRKFLTTAGRESLANERKLENTGTFNVLVCLMKWKDHAEANRELPPFSDYDILFNADVADALDLAGSVNTWFKTSSYGDFDVRSTVIDFVVTDNTEAFYANPNMGRSLAIIPAFTPVLDALDNGGSFDFSPFDQDGDNVIDMVVFLHSGYDGVNGNTDAFGATSDQRIASHARSASSLDWQSSTGFSLGSFVVAPAMRGIQNVNINKIGVIVHELIHLFGMPDLYDTDGPFTPSSGTIGGIANYDIMANPAGQGNSIAFPGHLSAWSRIFLGWADPMEITVDGTYQAKAVEVEPDIYIIRQGYANQEYLLIENRQAIPGDFDERFWKPGGITIYHIDDNLNVRSTGNTPRGFPGQAGWPGNGDHYPVALLQRDGLYELEQSLNGGHIDDVWFEADQELGPGNGELEANNAPYPNTDGYANGDITVTGLIINNFRAVDGTDPVVMAFDIIGLQAPEGPTEPPTPVPVAETTAPTANPASMVPIPDSPSPTSQPTPREVEITPSMSPTGIVGITISPTILNITTPAPVVRPSIPPFTRDYRSSANLFPTNALQVPRPSPSPSPPPLSIERGKGKGKGDKRSKNTYKKHGKGKGKRAYGYNGYNGKNKVADKHSSQSPFGGPSGKGKGKDGKYQGGRRKVSRREKKSP